MNRGVTAVIAAHHESAYLSETVRAVCSSTLPPSRIILVTKADIDVETGSIPLTVLRSDFSTTGEAYELARGEADSEWLWLLHDDSAPLPSTLELLLRSTDGKRAVMAAGPKQVAWDNTSALLEVGIVATRSARRVPELDPGEIDQGQFDQREDVLGVGTAGMLVRSRAIDDAGGFDPALGPFGDGLELSRRLRAAGGRVIVVPAAKIRHARQSFADSASSFGARRGAQAYNSLQGAPGLVFPFLFLFYLLLAPLRALARLVAKDGVRAGGEIWGGAFLLRRTGQLLKARSRLTRARTSMSYASMYAPLRDVRQGRADIRKALKEADRIAKRPSLARRRDLEALRARVRSAGFVLACLTIVLGVMGLAPYLSAFGVGGGAALPDSYSSAELTQAAFASWVPTGDGYPGYLEPLWVLAIPLVWIAERFGQDLTTVSFLLLVAGPFLAGMAAFRASREVANSAVVRFLAGALWAACPPLLSSISAGSLASVVFHCVIPLAFAGLLRSRRTGQSSALGAGAWWILIASAAYPPAALAFLILSLILAAVGRSGAWLWSSIPALAFVAPALWEAMKNLPESLVVLPGARFDVTLSSMWETIAGWPEGIPASLWWPIVIASGLLVVAAVWSIVRRSMGVALGWLLVAGGLGLISQVGLTTAAWPGPGMSLVWLGALTAIVSGAHGLRRDLTSSAASLKHVFVFGLVAALAATPVITAVAWVGSDMDLEAHSGDMVPALALRNSVDPVRSRVLVLDPSGTSMDIQVWRGNGPQLTESTTAVTLSGQGEAAAADLAAAIGAIGSPDFAEGLARHAISIILVVEDDAPSRDLAEALDATDNISRVTTSTVGTFWRVDGAGRITQDGGVLPSKRISATVEADPGPLYLAERADPGWVATMNGEHLPVISDDWRQVWDVPEAGTVHITHQGIFSQWWMTALRAMAVLANLIVCLPIRRQR